MDSTYYRRTKYACFMTSLSTSVTGNLPPLLFLTFRDLYGISYSLLGTLIVLNFGTQLILDLIFSFFSHKFNIKLSVKMTPFVMFIGLLLFAAAPLIFPNSIYLGLALGTVVFAAGSGLSEVLTSPTIAAIPSDNPDRLMSRLHSCYAWGVLFTVAFSTLFISLFGAENWQILTLILSLLPLSAAVMIAYSPMPPMETPERSSDALAVAKDPTVIFFIICIFLGGTSECTMSQWCSGYLETVFGTDKAIGDLCGFAMFGAALGLGRSLYGKIGKNIEKVLFFGSAAAAICYIVTVITNCAPIGLIACAVTGFFVSMLWPGSLIAVSERVTKGGVALYALMAMGGDLGASLCPQIFGIITDSVIASPYAADVSARLGMSAEQLGMRAAMAFSALFPTALAIMYFILISREKKFKNK